MFIRSLTLINYKPFLLRGIKRVYINFTSIYQLIIGTNGTGKSSILRQLSPLPGHISDFTADGGSKEIIIDHNNQTYRLVSTFTEKGGRHEFWVNNANLNNGGTITSQRELVHTHFGLSQTLFNVLMGETKFTHMNAIQRRDWLLHISGMNLDYAMDIYERLRVKVRDSAGIVKHYTKRFNEESDKLPDDKAILALEDQVELLNAVFLDLNKARYEGIEQQSTLVNKAKGIINDTQGVIQKVLRKEVKRDPLLPDIDLSSDANILTAINACEKAIRNETEFLATLETKRYELSLTITEIDKGAKEGCVDLQTRLEALQKEFESNQSKLQYLVYDKDTIDHMTLATETIREDLIDILTTIPANTGARFNESAMAALMERKDKTLNDITLINTQIEALNHQIKHATSDDKTTCPQCSYAWVVGYENVDPLMNHEKIFTLNSDLAVAKNDIQDIESLQDLYETYTGCIRRLNRHYKNSTVLNALWMGIANKWGAAEYPQMGMLVFNQWMNDIRHANKMHHIEKDIAELQQALGVVVGDFEGKIDKIRAYHKVYGEKIEVLLTSIDTNKQVLKELKSFRHIALDMEKCSKLINQSITTLESIAKDISKSAVNETIDQFINHVRTDLANVVTRLNKAKNAKAVIDKLKEGLDESERDNRVAKLLTKLISPVDGIIAEKLSLFVDNFVEQMNFIISQIWSHEFYLLPPQRVNHELDYIFPTKLANNAFYVPDVVNGSSSQVDIVNFSFRLVTMLYLGLESYPIYLDELAPSLDETHRANIISFIKEFVDARQCSQMFMISHYVTNHGVFTQAEVCVTDKKNILTLPNVYNQHAVFE